MKRKNANGDFEWVAGRDEALERARDRGLTRAQEDEIHAKLEDEAKAAQEARIERERMEALAPFAHFGEWADVASQLTEEVIWKPYSRRERTAEELTAAVDAAKNEFATPDDWWRANM